MSGAMQPKIAPRGRLGIAHNRPVMRSISDGQIGSPRPKPGSWCRRLDTVKSRRREPDMNLAPRPNTPSGSLRLLRSNARSFFAESRIVDRMMVRLAVLLQWTRSPRIAASPSANASATRRYVCGLGRVRARTFGASLIPLTRLSLGAPSDERADGRRPPWRFPSLTIKCERIIRS